MKAMLATVAALPALIASAEIDPLTTRWTFGAHEPYTMYRRVGKSCTGSIDGNALWVKDWLDWFEKTSTCAHECSECGYCEKVLAECMKDLAGRDPRWTT